MSLSLERTEPQSLQRSRYNYLTVVGLFFVYLTTLGQLNSFSAYQDYYEESMLSTYSPSTISWVGTSQVFLLGIVGLLSGAMYDRGYIRQVLIPGFVFVVLGLLLLSFSRQFWHVLLSQGFLVGIGGGLLYVPAISIVSHNFATRSELALAIAGTGASVGGIIWPISFRRLLASIGFAWANRVIAFIVLVLAVGSYFALMVHSRLNCRHIFELFIRRPKTEKLNEGNIPVIDNGYLGILRTAFEGQGYQFLCIGIFFTFFGYWVPLFYIVPYAARSLDTSPTYASNLLAILNAGSLFGRVIPAAVSHKVGVANVLLAGVAAMGVVILAWIGVESVAGITVWSVVLGFTTGSIITMPNPVAARLSQVSNTGVRIGIMWAVAAVAELIGPPIAGALLTQRDGKVSYLGCQVFGGVSVLIGAVFLTVPAYRTYKDGRPEQQLD
ncbi:major facilitator superfamily domain-containing protein [Xylaria bambusicola]|uniref:major facilitator superfamily domain-containing protein n=1 Tax=Xylaria bambusicola TaxID=326684 RepID=UPI0020085347|nr:major facilitator superfamily domain-containing protein [Xylaria bambusicola]KAI0508755.1 major facilitator superfamily domain-containing protein [Xylaria bambusicola]